MARGKGEHGLSRVPADKTQPLKYWQASIELPSRNGVRRRKVMRAKDKKVLLARLSEADTQLKAHGDLPTNSQTMEQWLTYWLDRFVAQRKRPNTAANYRGVVNKHIIPTIGHIKLDKVTSAHVRRVTDDMAEKGLSSTYQLNAHRILSTSFTDAISEDRILINPARRIKAPLKGHAPQEAFEVEEAIAVLAHVLKDPAMGARWATSLLTGARRGEVIGIEVDRVTDVLDLSWQLQRLKLTEETGVPVVPADYEYRHVKGGLYLTRPKTGKSTRIIPLVDPLKSILATHIAASEPNPYGLLFTRNGNPIDPDQDSKEWKAVLAQTGIDRDVVLHGLRHTAIDLLYLAGVPEDLIMDIVGQSTRGTTRGYKSRGRVNMMRLEAAMQDFSKMFLPSQPELEQ